MIDTVNDIENKLDRLLNRLVDMYRYSIECTSNHYMYEIVIYRGDTVVNRYTNYKNEYSDLTDNINNIIQSIENDYEWELNNEPNI